MRFTRTLLTVAACLAFQAACSRCGSATAPDGAGPDAGAAGAAAGDALHEPVVWKDEAGRLLPADDLAFGTPVPRKMKKVVSGKTWCRYEGTWKVEEVLEFYQRYLTLPEYSSMEEKGRSFLFKDAKPREPGNTGRLVEVRVIDEKTRGVTAVMIFDRSQDKIRKDWDAVPPYDPKTWKPSKPGEPPPDELM
jgi:hypothetical protein